MFGYTIKRKIKFNLRFGSLFALALFLIIMLFLTFFSRHAAELLMPQVTGVSPGPQVINNEIYQSCLPLKAVHQEGGKAYVFLISQEDTALGKEMVVKEIEVQVEDENDKYAALAAGLASNESFVLTSNKPVASGERVNVAN